MQPVPGIDGAGRLIGWQSSKFEQRGQITVETRGEDGPAIIVERGADGSCEATGTKVNRQYSQNFVSGFKDGNPHILADGRDDLREFGLQERAVIGVIPAGQSAPGRQDRLIQLAGADQPS